MKPGEWIPAASVVELHDLKRAPGAGHLGYIRDGAWATFGPFDFSDGLVDRVEIELAAPAAVGRIAVLLDGPDGSQVGEVVVRRTGSYETFAVWQGHAEQLAGTHRVVLQFRGGDYICDVRAFRFLKPDQPGTPGADRDPGDIDSEAIRREVDQLLAANREAIEMHRTAVVTLQTPPGATVEVTQVRHGFEFGTAINRSMFGASTYHDEADVTAYRRILKENFNSVVHENAMKWYSNEYAPDQFTYEAADAMLDWAEQNGFFTRGHAVYWGRDKLVPKWQKELDDDALRAKLQDRAKRYMTRYKGRVPEHDINNEMVHCTYYKKRLGGDIRKQMFDWCAQYDPDATLYVNDYSILSGGDTGRYIDQIDGFLKAGMKVGGIGVQGHFGSRVDGPAVRRKLDQLAKFGLPIKVTEFDANTKDEAAKAVALATLYTTAFAHPAIKGIYMWGFWEKRHWRPKAAIWNADWSETHAAGVYRDLVFNRWWTDAAGTADAEGRYAVRVFFGDHDVTVNGRKHRISVNASDAARAIDLRGGAAADDL